MHELNQYSSWKKLQILRWHNENVVVACLSADEVHTPPGDPQDKLHLLKNIQKQRKKISRISLNNTRNSRQ